MVEHIGEPFMLQLTVLILDARLPLQHLLGQRIASPSAV